MAKKAKAKKAKAQPKKKVAAKRAKPPARKSPAKGKAAKRPAPAKTKAAKTKVAARAAAARKNVKPSQPSKVASVAKVAAGVALLAMDAVTKRLPWAKDQNDPIELLKTDHRHFETLLKDGESTTERAKKGRREILDALTSGLNVHEALEEKVFYPALQPHAEAHDLVLEGSQEHHVADQLVKELHELEKDDEQWGAKFKVLKENVEHHISDEENKLFPVARGVLPKEELLALGAKMRALRAELEK